MIIVVPDSDISGYKIMAVSHLLVKSSIIITLKHFVAEEWVKVVILISCS